MSATTTGRSRSAHPVDSISPKTAASLLDSQAELRAFVERGAVEQLQDKWRRMPTRTCSASFKGTSGTLHDVDSGAESRYEEVFKPLSDFDCLASRKV
jgi:hypothetical protein